ncbi:MAG: PTS cellobiose transporter subunit IIC [Thermosediminibacteraceae bacterium]|nr:PTS cellobiose transporter subunit IIC [Thermosediminibacteraceae bacterium]
MEAFISFLENHFMPIAGKIAEQRHLKSIRDGVVSTMPLLLLGSLILIIAYPPISSLEALVRPYVDDLSKIVNATFGIIGLVASFSIAYSLAGSYKIDQLAAGILSLSAFLIVVPITEDGGISLTWTGSRGLFVAMIIAIITVEIQRKFVEKNLIIRMPEGVPPSVARSFAALIPGFMSLLLVWSVNTLLLKTLNLSLPEFINKVVAVPLMNIGGSLPAMLLAVFVVQLLWTVGIHGAAVVEGILGPLWIAFAEQNAAARAAGEAVLPNIISMQFFQIFVQSTGSGVTLPLVLLMLFAARSKQLKAVGKAALGPGIFNINEPVTFGLPIVMNPIMIIPFILAPLAVTLITYFAMAINLVARPYAIIPWTTPMILSGFLTTGDWKAGVLQIINVLVAGAIYYPFLKLWDRNKLEEERDI